jgi:hypothetical protein
VDSSVPQFAMIRLEPVTDEQVFYDKFLCDKFYLLVCTRNSLLTIFSMTSAFEQVHLSIVMT